MPRKPGPGFDEKTLTKGQLRKLTALRKSLGEEIANGAFAQWLKSAGARTVLVPTRTLISSPKP